MASAFTTLAQRRAVNTNDYFFIICDALNLITVNTALVEQ